MKKSLKSFSALLFAVILTLCSCQLNPPEPPISLENVPAYSGSAYVAINGNEPHFTDEEKATVESYEFYSELDTLGRCGYTVACVGKDIMPTEDREEISSVYPSGWRNESTKKSYNKKYDTSLVSGGYIYNRCHLIGFQLTGENDNERNLITGTRYLNIDGMLPFENMVADYVKETSNHVMYRVTPVYDGYNLVASGVLIEGYSVEDKGEGICFCVYAYNVQPGIVIDYKTGNNRLATEGEFPEIENAETDESEVVTVTYILNKKSKKIHLESCSGVASMSEANKQIFTGNARELIENEGYTSCGTCKPFG